MKIELNIKGFTTEVSRASEIPYVMARYGGESWSNYGERVRIHNDHVVVYHAEKHRRKVEVLDKPIKLTKKKLEQMFKAPQDGLIKRNIVKRAHWKITTYLIPIAVIKAAGLKVVQDNRTFTMSNRLNQSTR